MSPTSPGRTGLRMVKLLSLASCVVAAGLTGCGRGGRAGTTGDASRMDIPGLVRQVGPSVVLVCCTDANGDTLCTGSGFFISPDGHVVTNRHVLAGAVAASVKTADGASFDVRGLAAEDTVWDIVALATTATRRGAGYLKIAAALPEVGSEVLVVGCPLGLEQSVTDGIVSAVRDLPRRGKVIQLTAPISPGSSGSPVVNSSGEVVGVATFYLSAGQNLNFAVPGSAICALAIGEPAPLSRRGPSCDVAASLAQVLCPTNTALDPLVAWRLGLRCHLNRFYAEAARAFELAARGDTLRGAAQLMACCSWLMLDSVGKASDILPEAERCCLATDFMTMARVIQGCAAALSGSPQAALVEFDRATAAGRGLPDTIGVDAIADYIAARLGYRLACQALPHDTVRYVMGRDWADAPIWGEKVVVRACGREFSPPSAYETYWGDFAWGPDMRGLLWRASVTLSTVVAARLLERDADVWLDLARVRFGMLRYDHAERCAMKAIAAEPRRAEAHLLSALSRWNREVEWARKSDTYSPYQGYEAAIAACKMAVAVNPNYTAALLWHGEFSYRLGRNSEASGAFRLLARRNPDSAEALYGRGIGLLMKNDRAGALKVYENLRERDDALAQMLFEHIY